MYLRQFRNLRLVNLAGNPFCKEHDYRSYVLSHIKDLTYLDYRRVVHTDVQQAMEQHQVRWVEGRGEWSGAPGACGRPWSSTTWGGGEFPA